MSYNGPDPFPVHTGGTGANTLTGVLTGNGTSAITGHAVTQHSLLLAGASNVVDSLGVATNGQIPIGSTGADPVLATLTSSGSTITITNGAGSINLEVAGGGLLIRLMAISVLQLALRLLSMPILTVAQVFFFLLLDLL